MENKETTTPEECHSCYGTGMTSTHIDEGDGMSSWQDEPCCHCDAANKLEEAQQNENI